MAVFLQGPLAFGQKGTLEIKSTNSLDQRTSIAVPAFAIQTPALLAGARRVARIISDDLDFSGLFSLLPRPEYPSGFRALNPDVAKDNRDIWRKTRAEYLVYGVLYEEDGKIAGQFRLFELFSMEHVFGVKLTERDEKTDFIRAAAHVFSEKVIMHIAGGPGIATSEVIFSSGEAGHKEIYIADYDGANLRQVTHHDSVSILPQVSPDGQRIAYLSFKDRYPYLYIYDRSSGKSTPFSHSVGANIAPAWSPDGKKIALSLSKDGNSEIYLSNAAGSHMQRLTKNRYSDTSPTFSQDGRRIAFVSDRGGRPQIWVMDANGKNTRRLSYQGGNAYDPAWSPNGRMIAYVVEKSGEGLEIYVMGADGSDPRRLTDSPASNEAPSWSPDSRHLVFTSERSGRPQLWTVTLETGENRVVPRLGANAQGPTWGPRQRY